MADDESGFGWFTEVDTTPDEDKPVPEPKKINVWGEELDPSEERSPDETRSLEEIDNERFAEADAGLPWNVPEPHEDPVVEQRKRAVPKTVNGSTAQAALRSSNPLWEELDAEREGHPFLEGLDNFVFCGIAGPPGSGKSGMTLDSLSDEDKESGAEIWHVDYDRGGRTTKHAHHRGVKNIIVFDPWRHFAKSERVPVDYRATFERTMDILNLAVEQADRQLEYYKKHGKMPDKWLKTLVFDGSDRWVHICQTLMKVDDLGLGLDGIGAATKRVSRFNWEARRIRYDSAGECWKALMAKGVHVYTIAHMKPKYDGDGNIIEGQEVPGWLKDSDGDLQQIVIVELIEERDEMGRLTGVIDAYAVLTKNRTSLEMPGRHHIFHRAPEELGGSEWYGWPSLVNGEFKTDLVASQ